MNITHRPPPARLYSTEQLVAALAPFACDYAASIVLVRELPRSDAERALRKARGRYVRLLRAVLNTAALLSEEAA